MSLGWERVRPKFVAVALEIVDAGQGESDHQDQPVPDFELDQRFPTVATETSHVTRHVLTHACGPTTETPPPIYLRRDAGWFSGTRGTKSALTSAATPGDTHQGAIEVSIPFEETSHEVRSRYA
jgi:hypothetical protein